MMEERNVPYFTHVNHKVRQRFQISVNEYMVADTIHHLSNNIQYQWCEWTRRDIAAFLVMSEKTVKNIIARLIEKGYIELNPNTRLVRTTEKWLKTVYFFKNTLDEHDIVSDEDGGQEEGVNFTPKGKNVPPTEGVKFTPKGKNLPSQGVKFTPHSIYNIDSIESTSSHEDVSTLEDVTIEADDDMVPTKQLHRREAIQAGYKGHLVVPLLRWAEARLGNKFNNAIKQKTHISKMLTNGYTEEQIKEKWVAMELDPFWGDRGFDFSSVANEISKKKNSVKRGFGNVAEDIPL